jgi:hypothetical membrane protein
LACLEDKANMAEQSNVLKSLAICGILGPILYAVVIAVIGLLHPEYNHVSQSMSELGAANAPYAVIINTLGFPLLGLFMIAFAIGIDCGIKRNRAYIVGPALIVLSGLSLVMTGIFQCDPGCIDVTWVGTSHSVFATIAAISFSIAPIFIAVRQWADSRWRRYTAFSWAIAMTTLALSMLYSLDTFESYVGLLQRMSMGLPLVWMVITSIKLLLVKEDGEQIS